MQFQLINKLNALKKQKSFKYGVPFLIFIVGGSFGLKEFTSLRYQFSKKQTVKPDELEKMGVKMKNAGEVTLENEYEKLQNIDIDNWEQKRGPRPWEETT